MKKLFCLFMLLSFAGQAQVKFGNNPTTIDSASILELESPNKAFYLNRVFLTSTRDTFTVYNPKAGMVVYNINPPIAGDTTYPAGPAGAGMYAHDGLGWTLLAAAAPGPNPDIFWRLLGNANTVDGT